MAQALRELPEEGATRTALLERTQKRYRAGLLLGEVRKPEGNSSVTIGNALSRFTELESVTVRAGKGKEKLVERGPRFADLPDLAARIGAGVVSS